MLSSVCLYFLKHIIRPLWLPTGNKIKLILSTDYKRQSFIYFKPMIDYENPTDSRHYLQKVSTDWKKKIDDLIRNKKYYDLVIVFNLTVRNCTF